MASSRHGGQTCKAGVVKQDPPGAVANPPRLEPNLVEVAQRLADDVLFPRALAADRSDQIPVEQLNALADAGLFGVHSPAGIGGADMDRTNRLAVIEALAGGCLTTAFVWSQHGGPARASALANGPMYERWAARLASGQARGGVAFAFLLRSGPPVMMATPVDGGWSFTGVAPFVTGWGHIDVMLLAGRHGDNVVWCLVDAAESASCASRRLDLSALNGSVTAELTLTDHFVPENQITNVQPFSAWLDGYAMGLRENGSLALGVTGRCLRLLGPSALDDELTAARIALDTAMTDDADAMPSARAAATALGIRAGAALVAKTGGRAVQLSHHAQRLMREATFLLIQGQTAAIRDEHVKLFGA